jgi:sugar phosphate isomerase/epimerase
MLKLAGFADEISPELSQQINICKKLGITHFELRGVAGKNVLDFDQPLRAEIKAKLAENGLAVACIGSPIGKVKIDEPFEKHFDRFKIAVDSAHFFDAKLIRVFSYYPPEAGGGGDIKQHRDEVMRRFAAKVDYISKTDLTMVHENEARIFGEGVANCVDLMKTINSPKFQSAFDFANFVQAGEDPLKNWPLLKPYTVHIHIKDAKADGSVVPAGEGVGQLGSILKDAWTSGYRGFLSLEPHLAAHGQFSGFSGPDLFESAALALRKVCRENDIPLA